MARIIKIPQGGGGDFEYQTEITANTTLTTQEGLNKVYPVNSASAVVVTVPENVYALNDVINFERRGEGSVEFIGATDNVRIRGIRDIQNRYFINDRGGWISLACLGSDEFRIIGNLTRGGNDITTTSYGELSEGDVGVNITVIGTGFSSNMLVSVSANATLNSFTYISPTQITLNLDAVGVENDTVTVTYDNGFEFVDTDAITIGAAGFVIDDMANLVEYWKENSGDNTTGTATKTGVNGKVLSASGEGNPTLVGGVWQFDGVDDGFKLADTTINALINADAKDFQLHFKGQYRGTAANRIVTAQVDGTVSDSLWNMVDYSVGNFRFNARDTNNDVLTETIGTATVDTTVLVSLRFYQDSGNKLDIYVDNGTSILSSLAVDASNLNASAVDTLYVGMRGNPSYFEVYFNAMVIANSSADFDNVRTELAP